MHHIPTYGFCNDSFPSIDDPLLLTVFAYTRLSLPEMYEPATEERYVKCSTPSAQEQGISGKHFASHFGPF